MEKHRQNIDSSDSDKILWLTNPMFTAFPQEVTGLRFYILDCGCIYYQRVFGDGGLDSEIGTYSVGEDGPCEICMLQEENWKERVIKETVVYNSKFRIDVINK